MELQHLGPGLIALFVLKFVVSWIYRIVYNLYFHPLARFPGPKTAAISNISFSIRFLRGQQPYETLELHKKYGPVVRIAPGELSFNTAQSWKDIYGFRQNHRPFLKSEFYDGGSFAGRGVHSIVSERDPEVHGRMRRLLAHAFSNTSLKEQEVLISKTVDQFVEVVRTTGDGKLGINIGKLFEMMTFDIIGDLAFGETFHALETDEPHPWISVTLGALTQGALADTFKRFPMAGNIVKLLIPGKIGKLMEDTWKNEDMAIELVKKRITRRTDRKDFMTRILEHRDQEKVQVSDVELAAHASDFVLAGSETTATALACITYHLLKAPQVMRRLKKEIWQAFPSYEDINDSSTQPLRYLQAVCLEGMRVYSPLPFALPRVVPAGGDTVDGHFIPGGTIISTNPVAASLDAANFENPFEFRPERWIARTITDTLEASQPFSLGARGCLGKTLGWMELRTTLAKLLWTVELELLDQSLDWHGQSEMYTLWQKPALFVRATPRTAGLNGKARK